MSSLSYENAGTAADYDLVPGRSASEEPRTVASVLRAERARIAPETGTVLTRRLIEEGVENFSIRFDGAQRILWASLTPTAIPSVTPGMVKDIARIQGAVRRLYAEQSSPDARPIRYMVWASDMPGIWNLGGDLRLFMQLIRRKDRDQMRGPDRREALHQMTRQEIAPGLLAYVDGQVAGWCSVAPREAYARLEHSRNYKRIDEQPVVRCIATYMAFSAGQKILDPLPLIVAQAQHASAL